MLGAGSKDKSGDFTKGANLSSSNVETIENELKKKSPETEDLLEIIKIFEDYNFKNFEFDPSIIRGLEYYTGPIFEVNLKFDVKNNKGKVIQFGSIGGGGRYDDLTSTFGLNNMSGIGISFGFERIFLVMESLNLFPDELLPVTQVLFINFGSDAAALAYSCLSKLRQHNIISELYPTEAKLKKQLGYANQKGILKVVLIGEEEVRKNSFIFKDMNKGTQKSYSIKDLISVIS